MPHMNTCKKSLLLTLYFTHSKLSFLRGPFLDMLPQSQMNMLA